MPLSVFIGMRGDAAWARLIESLKVREMSKKGHMVATRVLQVLLIVVAIFMVSSLIL